MFVEQWVLDNVPSMEGKTALVTGANSGLGLHTSRWLAKQGARVILACRNEAKANDAMAKIRAEVADADVRFLALDLSSLDSIKKASESFLAEYKQLDILCNNAGVMALPYRQTEDGFEMQFGTNHLGHFALTMHLLPVLTATPGARIVNVSSITHRIGKINFTDPNWTRRYQKWLAYSQSKLANLMFTFELQKRLKEMGADIIVAASHPGYAETNLQVEGPRMAGSFIAQKLIEKVNGVFSQSAEMGALPTIYAACARGVQEGDYFGPDGRMEIKGFPKRVGTNSRARDADAQARLWDLSEQLTGLKIPGKKAA